MVRFYIPQGLSSKLKLRLLNASEIIIIMQACVSLLAACVSLLVCIRSMGRILLGLLITIHFIKWRAFFILCVYLHVHIHPFETHFDTDVFMLNTMKC